MMTGGVVLLAIACVYAGVTKGLVTEWVSSPDASYGMAVAAVAAYTIVVRRRAFAAAIDPAARPAIGFTLLLAGLLLFLIGQLGADVFLTRMSLPLVAAGAVGFVAGSRALRTIAAPLAFLAVAIPPPALVVNAITLPLQFIASRIAEAALTAASVPVYRDGNVLALPSATLEVAEACSGLRSLVSLLAIGLLVAWLAETRTIRRAAIVAATVPIAIVMNGLRVAVTGIACETFGPRAASGGWHTFTGWITFVASLAVLAATHRLVRLKANATRPNDGASVISEHAASGISSSERVASGFSRTSPELVS
jgi:exosortase